MILLNLLSMLLILMGVLFYFASAVGLLRFPDTLCRLHALAKADNLALGCIILGLILNQSSPFAVGKLVLIWGITLLSSATGGFLLAQRVRRKRLHQQERP